MKQRLLAWTCLIALSSLPLSSPLRADGGAAPIEQEETRVSTEGAEQSTPTDSGYSSDLDKEIEEEDDDDETPQGTPVSPATQDSEQSKKRQFWKNIILAAVAVAVAAISIIVVSNNNGKSTSH